ncbi:CYFA0S14e00804g1_1 [Cyberlindnera fabianii]|uniref:amidase n=1 Tax=Cyberlindnera fabianii TaxID=36022 RepID=A0A061B8I9_CYBFA|nr:CYFA0S14e00804g1_1 [Cyberlindnera fabianii]
MTCDTYLEIAARKKAERDAKFKPEWLVPKDKLPGPEIKDVLEWPVTSGFLTAEEIAITEAGAPTILSKIKSKEWTAVEVASAFGHRATIAHQLTNCLSEIFFEEGLTMAKELDEYYATTGKLKGPLHGLPISLKDNLNIKGQPTSIGFVGFAFNPPKFEDDAVLVGMLREMGAVFYVKTNVPVAMMMPESINFIYGNTVNPFNRDLTAGGSSGGEAALIALKGSPIGIGSDIGGSLRIPAANQNLFTIRSSGGRFPTYGARSGLPGLESVNSVNGPISTSLDAVEFYSKTVIDGEPWLKDGKVIEMPWRDVDLPEKLTFGVIRDDGVVHPYPAVLRGLDHTVEKLREAGHEVIEWEPQDHERLDTIITEFFLSDGGEHCKEYAGLTGEPFFPYMEMYNKCKEKGVSELWDLHAERTTLMKRYIDRWAASASMTSTGKPIDAILMPVSPYSGVGHGKFRYVGYTAWVNALDYTAGTVPVLRADKSIDKKEADYVPKNSRDEENYALCDTDEVDGGPVSVQVVGRRLQEEKVLKMMRVVAKAVGTEKYWG